MESVIKHTRNLSWNHKSRVTFSQTPPRMCLSVILPSQLHNCSQSLSFFPLSISLFFFTLFPSSTSEYTVF